MTIFWQMEVKCIEEGLPVSSVHKGSIWTKSGPDEKLWLLGETIQVILWNKLLLPINFPTNALPTSTPYMFNKQTKSHQDDCQLRSGQDVTDHHSIAVEANNPSRENSWSWAHTPHPLTHGHMCFFPSCSYPENRNPKTVELHDGSSPVLCTKKSLCVWLINLL